MENRRICLLPGGRRPVQAWPAAGLVDAQAQPPAGWCCVCGAEVYRYGGGRCGRCRRLGLMPKGL